MKDLWEIKQECERELDKIGIKYGMVTGIKINNRLKACWGRIKKHKLENGNYTYQIEICKDLVHPTTPIISLKETIIHELLHSCEGGWDGHRGEWKVLANKVNKAYPQYNIVTGQTIEEKIMNKIY